MGLVAHNVYPAFLQINANWIIMHALAKLNFIIQGRIPSVNHAIIPGYS